MLFDLPKKSLKNSSVPSIFILHSLRVSGFLVLTFFGYGWIFSCAPNPLPLPFIYSFVSSIDIELTVIKLSSIEEPET